MVFGKARLEKQRGTVLLCVKEGLKYTEACLEASHEPVKILLVRIRGQTNMCDIVACNCLSYLIKSTRKMQPSLDTSFSQALVPWAYMTRFW